MKVIGSKAEQRKERNTYKWKYKSQNSKTDLDIEPDWSSLLVWECACVFHVMQRGIQCMDNKSVEFTSPTATPAVLLWLCRGLCFPVCLPSWLYALLKQKGAIFYCSHSLSLSLLSLVMTSHCTPVFTLTLSLCLFWCLYLLSIFGQ